MTSLAAPWYDMSSLSGRWRAEGWPGPVVRRGKVSEQAVDGQGTDLLPQSAGRGADGARAWGRDQGTAEVRMGLGQGVIRAPLSESRGDPGPAGWVRVEPRRGWTGGDQLPRPVVAVVLDDPLPGQQPAGSDLASGNRLGEERVVRSRPANPDLVEVGSK